MTIPYQSIRQKRQRIYSRMAKDGCNGLGSAIQNSLRAHAITLIVLFRLFVNRFYTHARERLRQELTEQVRRASMPHEAQGRGAHPLRPSCGPDRYHGSHASSRALRSPGQLARATYLQRWRRPMRDFDQLWVWNDPAIAGQLGWYRDVAGNRKPAKFRIAATIPLEVRLDAPGDVLWGELHRLTP